MTLAELQRLFWRSVRFDPAPPEVEQAFVTHGSLSARERMAVYRTAYWARQIDVLWELFPRLGALLGEAVFVPLMCRYITDYPSSHPALEWLGEHVPAFVAAELGLDPRAAGLAALEWAKLEVLVERSVVPLRLTGLDAGRFAAQRVRLSPALRSLALSRAALAYHDALPAPTAPSMVRVAVWRNGFAVRHLELAADEASALCAAERGAAMAEVCAAFTATPEPQQRAATVLRTWFERGWIEELLG